jgi:hypothetical protein
LEFEELRDAVERKGKVRILCSSITRLDKSSARESEEEELTSLGKGKDHVEQVAKEGVRSCRGLVYWVQCLSCE